MNALDMEDKTKKSFIFNNFYKSDRALIFVDRQNRKILFSHEKLSTYAEDFLKHLYLVDKDVVELEFEGWNVISGKYPISPIKYCGFFGEDITLVVGDFYGAVIETSKNLLELVDDIKNNSLDDIILRDRIEAVGEIEDNVRDYRGCFTEEEINILNSIVVANNKLSDLLSEMLTILTPLKFSPNIGWFVVGREFSLLAISENNRWVLIENNHILKII